jgi:hypothetical protein
LFVLLFVIAGVTLLSGERASANHPVLVEGNCDSPVPGTTIVHMGTCGDFDGDGRIGTAEDTDGADRIFGTINAAMGPGTGAAAGTGANLNGRIIIVKSGRFAEQLVITPTQITPNVGHLQIEAAPGVEANIDAVLQGDPAGGNTTRQNGIGILVDFPAGRTVTLRNLTVRNFTIGLLANNFARVHIDNCRFDNNLNQGVYGFFAARITMNDSRITSTGFRIGGPSSIASPGNGLQFDGSSGGVISNTVIANSAGAGLQNNSGNAIRTFHLVFADNDGGSVVGNPVIKEDF